MCIRDRSDDLEAIRDGNRTVDGNQGGNTKSTMWSNYKNSKDAKDNDADITFQYATQQIFNQIKIFFRSDSHAASEMCIRDSVLEKTFPDPFPERRKNL